MQRNAKSPTKTDLDAGKNTGVTSGAKKSKIIKSKDRVRERAEVFTRPREVNNILALTQATSNPYWRFLEPACGNGNFLEAILRQRLERLKQDRIEWHTKNREFSVLKVLSTIYGVDIAEDNIEECKKRLKAIVFEYFKKKSSKGFLLAMDEIMRTNLIVGDMLNGKDKVYFVEYTTPMKNFFIRKIYALTDMESGIEKAIKTFPMAKYDSLTPIDFSFLDKDTEAPPGAPEVGKQTNLFGELI
ncbi:hypothetical protein J6D24_00485 [Candidatus Saccharibacteria bacterium]|nr:hypothetical protein [Candidatus Saccharibacteria bacterium]